MRLSDTGVPLIILSHRKREFLETCVASIKANVVAGVSEVLVVDDSGDTEHHRWLADNGYAFSTSSVTGENVGYLEAMQVVWSLAKTQVDAADYGSGYAMLWEEDFNLARPLDVNHMAHVMDHNATLAHLNLQRQAVYRIERRFGYIESHQRRGYGIYPMTKDGVSWIRRMRPFTTNPGLIRREVLDIDWPTREECDEVEGGAEPAMSKKLEAAGWNFGWLGRKNTPHTRHVGAERKTGHGY